MAIVLDETTRAEYLAQTLATSRAAYIVAALTGTVAVEIYDGADVLRASGTMASPWATSSGDTITIGNVGGAGISVSSGGPVDSSWYCQFRSGTRFVRGTFGLLGGSEDFIWSLDSFMTGTRALVGTATLVAQGGVSGNLAPVWATVPSLDIVRGGTVSVAGYVSDANNDALTFTVSSVSPETIAELAARGITLSSSGVFSATTTATLGLTDDIIVRADDGVAEAAITTFTLTSTTTQSNAPFMLGMPIRKGDVPAGTELVLDEPSARVVIKRRWNDGSAKHCIIVGRTNLTAATAKTLTIRTGSTSGTALTSANITAAAPTASVQCGAIGTVSLSSLLSSPFRTFVSTPEMVECHYRSAVAGDASLQVWFHVRLWAGGRMWVRAVVENGYIGQSPATRTYVPTVIIGGTTVYNNGGASLSHHAFSRWTATGWIGGDPAVTPGHNVAYMIATKLVPNYWQRNPTSAELNALPQTYTPMNLGPIETNLISGGFHQGIGLLPLWESLYASTGDARAFRSAISTATAFNIHQLARRPTSNRIAKLSDYPTTYIGDDNITFTAGEEHRWDSAHAPNIGYLAYLVTGDYYHHETHAFSALGCYITQNDGSGSGTSRRFTSVQTRAVAWSLNIIGTMCAIAPLEGADTADADAINEWRTLLATNYQYFADQIDVPGMNQLGTVSQYSTGAWNGDGSVATWMTNFWVAVNGFISDCEPLSNPTQVLKLRDWMYRWIVGLLGPTGASNYHFSRANAYGVRVDPTGVGTVFGPDPRSFYDSWGDVWTLTHGTTNNETTNALGGTLTNEIAIAYWANLLPAIAYAVDHGASGASTSWGRMTGASNWSTFRNGSAWSGEDWANTPIWGIVPRGFDGT